MWCNIQTIWHWKAHSTKNVTEQYGFIKSYKCVSGRKQAGRHLILYKDQSSESLDALRHHIFYMKVVQVHSLPPTAAAAKFHSQRVYLQVQEWMGKHISPLNWGWKLKGVVYVPIMTDPPEASDELLKLITCKCKKNCENINCICRKHGLACSQACGECHGVSCSNSTKVLMEEDETDTIWLVICRCLKKYTVWVMY